jgi:phenylalanyl-tRNA synthetase beta chain
MKISYRWLKEFVDFELTPRDLADRLTMVGLAVDAVDPHGDDAILDFDLTSNRPDCLSHLGVAREAAVLLGQTLRLPKADLKPASSKVSDRTPVEVSAPDLCPRYTARVITGVRIAESPAWLAARLEALGQRTINNVADITNYVLLELGQPLHAFDFDQLRGRRIIVRRAKADERLTTLDGTDRALTPEMLVIADAERPVALAGIMGGADSEISNGTTTVLLESAYFAPLSIRQTARALGMATEASYRFERGADYQAAGFACDRAAALIAEWAGGQVLDGIIDVYPMPISRSAILFRRDRFTALTGLQVELSEAERILQQLGFRVNSEVESGVLEVRPPSWRVDVAVEEDVVEEVARITGYDRLQTSVPRSTGAGAYLEGESGRRCTRQALTAMGYEEAISFSFVNAAEDRAVSDVINTSSLTLSNPIDDTQNHMRTTLLGGLLDAVARNINHGTRSLRLFEMGKCFESSDGDRPLETERLGLAGTGLRSESGWERSGERFDFYDLKGAVEAIAESLAISPLRFAATGSISYLHPGRAAVISLGEKEIGRLGQLHPRAAARFKFKQPVFVAELDFGALLAAERLEPRYRPLPRFPTVARDLSILVNESVTYAEIERTISDLDIPELVSVRLFDIYSGSELPPGKHSLALAVRFRALDRTLTDVEVNQAYTQIVAALGRRFAAELR